MRAIELLAGHAWLMDAEHLRVLADVALRQGEGPEAVAVRLGRPLQNARDVQVRDGVAVVPLVGPLFRRANLFTEVSGATSTEVFARDFTAAIEDPSVAAILLEIDSPGGEVNGVNEVAALVRAARGAKPVVAYVGGTGASGAYWIASAADRIVADATAVLGSIGVVARVVDTSEQDAQRGVFQIVSSQSPLKRSSVRTEEGRSELQRVLDATADVFVQAVAANRGVSVETVLADFGQGGVRVGREAVAAGMADSLGSLEGTLAELSAGRQATRTAAPAGGRQTKVESMDLKELTAEALAAARPDLVTALTATARAEGEAAGRTAGAAAERERILGIEAKAALPGHDALIAQLKADGTTSPEAAAAMVVAAERQKGGKMLDALRGDEGTRPAPKAAPQADAGVDPAAPLEERAKAAWAADAGLRAEFGDSFPRYLAYRKAEGEGRVKRLVKAG